MKPKIINLAKYRRFKKVKEPFARGRKLVTEKDGSLAELAELQQQVQELKRTLFALKGFPRNEDEKLH